MQKKGICALSTWGFIFFATWVLSAGVPEKKPDDWGAEQGDAMPLVDPENQQVIDDAHKGASDLLLNAADWIDSFFYDDRYSAEENETRATLKMSLGYTRKDELEIQPRLDIRLKLPKLSSRAQLIIEAAEDSDFVIDEESTDNYEQREDEDSSQLQAALRFFLKESDDVNIAFDFGGSWNYLYTSIRYRKIMEFDDWLNRFTNRLRWYTDDGWENRMAYDLETNLTEELFFRATTKINYYDTKDGFPHSQRFRLYQVLSSIRAVVYETAIYLDTEPSHRMSDMQFIVRYRQRFYRDWLMLEISPRVTFPEETDYEINPGLIFKLEASLGNDASEHGFRKIFK